MSATTVTLEEDGTIRIPREILEAMRLSGQLELRVDVDSESQSLTLTPDWDEEDRWLYESDEVQERIARGRKDITGGRIRSLTEEDLRALAPND